MRQNGRRQSASASYHGIDFSTTVAGVLVNTPTGAHAHGDADVSFLIPELVSGVDDDPAGTRIPGALDRVLSAGVTFEPRQPLFGSLRVRHFGPRPLIEDASVTSKCTTLWNGETGYRMSNRARVLQEAFNLFDREVSDIDYFYASRLPGEPADGFEDIHFHPALPRSARLGIQLTF